MAYNNKRDLQCEGLQLFYIMIGAINRILYNQITRILHLRA